MKIGQMNYSEPSLHCSKIHNILEIRVEVSYETKRNELSAEVGIVNYRFISGFIVVTGCRVVLFLWVDMLESLYISKIPP